MKPTPSLPLLTLTAGLLSACAGTPPAAPGAALRFDASHYVARSVTVDGQTLAVRAYENLPYVALPVDAGSQRLNLYIPEAYFHGGRIRGYTAQTAPIFLPNQIGGYMPAEAATLAGRGRPPMPDGGNGPAQPPTGEGMAPPAGAPEGMPAGGPGPAGQGDQPSSVAQALARGYIVASPGARGRTSQDSTGRYTGKAPAAIVDLKAAVRYLRFNDAQMPGDAEKIISNGTSAGGALSALLGASGNSPDFETALNALGAAPARDQIFAVSAYCPITNLEQADAAYEWQLHSVHDYRKIDMSMLDFKVQRKEVAGTLSAGQIAVSAALKQGFPAYVNSLQLQNSHGEALRLDAEGNGSFKDHIKSLLLASAQRALDQGQDLSRHRWLKIEGTQVRDLDFDGYLQYLGRMKLPPAFDALDLSSGENQLFGTETVDKRHFTAFASQHNTAAGASQADAGTVAMMNAMHYVGSPGSAPHWRIRHGSKDKDTSLAIPALLALSLQNRGSDVDFALAWDRPHSGDYDLNELFAWIDQISQP